MVSQVRLQNNCGGVRGFFGASSISKKGKVPGLRILPGEKKVLLPAQVEALKDQGMPHAKILQALIKKGELLDIDDAFSNEHAQAEPGDIPLIASDEPAFMQDDGAPAQKLADLTSLEETAALAAVLDEDDLQVLKAWFMADTRAAVKDQINKRGEYIVKKANEKK